MTLHPTAHILIHTRFDRDHEETYPFFYMTQAINSAMLWVLFYFGHIRLVGVSLEVSPGK